MKKRQLFDIDNICIALCIIAIIIAVVFDKLYISLYLWFCLWGIDVIRHLYALFGKHRHEKAMQLDTLCQLKSLLCRTSVISIITYVIVYLLFEYNSPTDDSFIVLLGLFVILTMLSFIVCICITNKMKTQVQTNK